MYRRLLTAAYILAAWLVSALFMASTRPNTYRSGTGSTYPRKPPPTTTTAAATTAPTHIFAPMTPLLNTTLSTAASGGQGPTDTAAAAIDGKPKGQLQHKQNSIMEAIDTAALSAPRAPHPRRQSLQSALVRAPTTHASSSCS